MGITRRAVFAVTALLAVALAATGVGLAEDVKGKWYVGGSYGVLVPMDNMRSNAALIIAPLGADGAPFTGDKGEAVSCDATATNVYCDPRPDDLIARETAIQQTMKLDFTLGYGLTSNLSLQLDIGYYEGHVNNFDVFTRKDVPISLNPLDPCLQLGQKDPCLLNTVRSVELRQPVDAGGVTEIPVMLDAIARFRKDSNFNPYLGLGVGYLFTKLDQDPSVDALNARLKSQHIIVVTDEFGPSFGEILSRDPVTGRPTQDVNGNLPFQQEIKVSIDSGFQFQLMAGGEYFFNDRLSLVFDARYVVNNQQLKILMNGEDQINVEAYTEDLFRKDGSLRVFKKERMPPNPVDPNSQGGAFRFTCDPAVHPPPYDYDGDGQDDACFAPDPQVPSAARRLQEVIVVQGGDIRLTNFTVGLGVRFHF